ncbi:MAG: transcription-repair coupling factor [Verrucomicrobiales bacterium]|nr:transcription-repair coupling factor [Akkermansiaceae bacterium]
MSQRSGPKHRSSVPPQDSGSTASRLLAQSAAAPGLRERLDLLESAAPGRPVIFDHVAEAGHSLYAGLIAQRWTQRHPMGRVWFTCPHIKAQENLHAELPIWGSDALFLPEHEWSGFEDLLPDPETAAERLATLREIHERRDLPVVLCLASFDEDVPAPGHLSDQITRLQTGQTIDPAAFAAELLEAGYEKTTQVFQRGQFAVRGGIVDVFSWQSPAPVRIELFGDDIDSLREFDVDEQTSVRRLDSVEILLGEANLEHQSRLTDYLGPDDLVVAVECHTPLAAACLMTGAAPESSGAEDFSTACHDNPTGTFEAGDFILQEQKREQFAAQMSAWKADGWTVAMAFNSQGEIDRFTELVDAGHLAEGRLLSLFGTLSRGFTVPAARLAVLSDAEIFGRYQHQRVRRRFQKEAKRRALSDHASITQFARGDFVVHLDYGIGKFLGIRSRETQTREGSRTEEVLEIQYADQARLYVPLDQAHLVSRYIGAGAGKGPELGQLGGKRWAKTRREAEASIMDYAARMLQIQARRQTDTGLSHEPDNKWQWEFENAFIHKETPDQLRAIAETKRDMESPLPMDRLICGDVGFGKTEVAIRAAFKSVMGGRQVAILTPTTVLAQQHWQTFRERMSDFPVRIDLLSRYRTPQEQRQTLADLASGAVDIVVGTHRLISKDIRFKNLGLVVIDEEQRFGVKHKERFKDMFHLVDLLTLSATPIPRTLYLSLMGVKDMSTIDTPPPNRIPVQTSICPFDEKVMKTAIERELARQGQVYLLHNRVSTIDEMAHLVTQLVPGVRVGVGHGQMEDEELEDVMSRFVRQEIDVLVCTTIIESGVDIPNANTIIIDRADRFGLADLYQLRGRVGRSDRRAYAYLMLPRDLMTVGDARKRINAIKEYSSLGAGFKIAMRDLEIRGAGNLLGTQQSGHIAAIGFDLYCQLLKQSVNRLKGEDAGERVDLSVHIDFLCTNEAQYLAHPAGLLPAYIPASYMPGARLRITAYRQLAEATQVEELESLRRDWTDQFGRLPDAAAHLLLLTELKIRASRRGASSLEIRDGKLMVMKKGSYLQIEGKFPRLTGKTNGAKLKHALEWVKEM